jgi:hypothetical protein
MAPKLTLIRGGNAQPSQLQLLAVALQPVFQAAIDAAARELPRPVSPGKKLPRHRGDDQPVWCYTEAQLAELRPHLMRAAKMWHDDHFAPRTDGMVDGGTCVLGAGLAVWVAVARKRYAVLRLVVSAPGQNDGSGTRQRAQAWLLEQGIVTEYEYGRMD